MLIFGSTALKHWFPDYEPEPKDIDWLSDLPIETWRSSTGVLNEVHWCEPMRHVLCSNKDKHFVDPNFLYTIKLSHLPWDLKNGKWWKHLKDCVFMQDKGYSYDPFLLYLLEKEWEVRHGSKAHIKLDKPVEDFFNDNVKRKYEHDELHQLFKIGDVPAYSLITPDANSAKVSFRLFDKLDDYTKLCTIAEEVFVTAYERNLSFSEGYKHVVTRLSRGWWNVYCRTHAKDVLDGFKQEKRAYAELRRKL